MLRPGCMLRPRRVPSQRSMPCGLGTATISGVFLSKIRLPFFPSSSPSPFSSSSSSRSPSAGAFSSAEKENEKIERRGHPQRLQNLSQLRRWRHVHCARQTRTHVLVCGIEQHGAKGYPPNECLDVHAALPLSSLELEGHRPTQAFPPVSRHQGLFSRRYTESKDQPAKVLALDVPLLKAKSASLAESSEHRIQQEGRRGRRERRKEHGHEGAVLAS
eukprot:scaffold4178_cov257-Pinguiococcus_pyrenoidosus.AAC.8